MKFYQLSQGPMPEAISWLMRFLGCDATPAEQIIRHARNHGYDDTLLPMIEGKPLSGVTKSRFKQLGIDGKVNARSGEVWRNEFQEDRRPTHKIPWYNSFAGYLDGTNQHIDANGRLH